MKFGYIFIIDVFTLATGVGALGAFTFEETTWDDGAFVTSVHQYEGAVVFSQSFPHGVIGSNLKADDPMHVRDEVSTSFPTFAPATDLGYLAFSGDMTGSGFRYGQLSDSNSSDPGQSGKCRISQKVTGLHQSGAGSV